MKRRNFLSLSALSTAAFSAIAQQETTAATLRSLSQWEGYYRVSNNTIRVKPHQLVDSVNALSTVTKQPVLAAGNTLNYQHLGRTLTVTIELIL